jgi:pimeloyl-ACP methyl ester carboxylesterase
MQLGALSRWWRRDARTQWEGPLFTVTSEGRGRDVVLVHGLAASPACWDGARAGLGENVRLHLVHLRGFGGLPAAQPSRGRFLTEAASGLAAYISSEIGEPAAVAGHSMGGLIALILGRDHPRAAGALMVVDVPSFFSMLISPFATAGSVAGLAELARRRYIDQDRARLEEELRRSVRKLVMSQAAVEPVVRWGLLSDQTMTADVMAEVMVTDLRPDLPRIKAPVDVVYAWERSGPTTRSSVDRIYEAAYAGLADCRKLRIDEARHYIMLDQPDAFYGAMRAWLTRRTSA